MTSDPAKTPASAEPQRSLAARFMRHPTVISALVVWICWLAIMSFGDLWWILAEYWPISLTMAVGSFIAGASSEGGGAVAFPVFTLGFGIAPHVARDFSLMIQSVGMTSAAITIIMLRIPVAWQAILYAGLGGVFGIILSLEFVAPNLAAPYAKTFFTACWLSFGTALLLINWFNTRGVGMREKLPDNDAALPWLLGAAGFAGGIISGITGTGIDILTFSLIVLAFRLSERIATPTSVILMAMNSLLGFAWKGIGPSSIPISPDAWNFWLAAVPIVVVGAPIGAMFIRNKPREVILGILLTAIVVQYVAALILIPQTPQLIAFNIATFALGSIAFIGLGRHGLRKASEDMHRA
ncbi:MAG: TSUP family transporter [Paracoccaceae bacterium]